MKEYVKHFPVAPSFSQNGFDGFNCNLDNKNISITLEDVFKGHDKYCINKESTHIYFVISGNGTFKIDNEIYEIKANDIIEIPANTNFVFAGKMKLLLIMNPAFDKKNDVVGNDNDLY